MEIHQLRYFCAVAKNGTFTRAAMVERVAQPSLSQQILKLETELGAKLFERLPRSVRLTSFGAAFLPKAERILRELSDAKAEIVELSGKEDGELLLGAIPTIAPYLLPAVLSRLSRLHPAIVVRVTEDTTQVLVDQLHKGSLHMVIAALPVQGADLLSCELFRETFFIVMPETHPLAMRKSIRIEELRSEPFLLLKEGHCFRESTLSLCRKSKIAPNVVFESGQFATILGLVSAGVGISAVPKMAVQPVPGCKFIPLANGNAGRRIGAVSLSRHFQTKAEKLFLELLKQVGSTLNRQEPTVRAATAGS
jgi:LysR family transcriptional regulator, hydrogen peroxide-inducible genes activator